MFAFLLVSVPAKAEQLRLEKLLFYRQHSCTVEVGIRQMSYQCSIGPSSSNARHRQRENG